MKQKEHMTDFPALLRDMGLKATPGRISLLEFLSKESKPLTVSAIQKKFGKKIDTVTLYRTLEDFADKGIVRRVDFEHSHAHYEIVAGRKHHHHIICKKCEKVEDVDVCESEGVERNVLQKVKDFSFITNHSLEFFGICNQCIKSN
ncbi:MAG: transcriptional repressor [Candidatus Pacebacteria bacterium]|nr:transcriptional repressor [Candidatus Paceibacterota bacterium]